MNTTQTYAVFPYSDPADAETDLTAHEVVRHIYRYDGSDYRLEPKMIRDRHDEEGNGLPDAQDTFDDDLVFEVWFKYSGYFLKGQCLAIGKNEEEAESAFLQKAFDSRWWDTSYWIVLSTKQYLAELGQ